MGAHESNRGLCKALLRAFETMRCHQSIPKNSNESPNLLHTSQLDDMCNDIVHRLIVRQCPLPDVIADAEWHLSADVFRRQQQ